MIDPGLKAGVQQVPGVGAQRGFPSAHAQRLAARLLLDVCPQQGVVGEQVQLKRRQINLVVAALVH